MFDGSVCENDDDLTSEEDREFEKEWTEQEHNPMKSNKNENKTSCFNVCICQDILLNAPLFRCFFLNFPSAI